MCVCKGSAYLCYVDQCFGEWTDHIRRSKLVWVLQLRTSSFRPHTDTDVVVRPAAIDDPSLSHSWAVNYPVRCLELAALIMIPHCHLSQSASASSPVPIGYKVDVGRCPPPTVSLPPPTATAKSVQ